MRFAVTLKWPKLSKRNSKRRVPLSLLEVSGERTRPRVQFPASRRKTLFDETPNTIREARRSESRSASTRSRNMLPGYVILIIRITCDLEIDGKVGLRNRHIAEVAETTQG
jgi:hypothetical protein